jgi:hypothetical protein
VKEVFLSRLGASHPDLVADYRRRYRDRAYAPKADQQAVATVVRDLVRQHGGVDADRGDAEHMTGRPAAPGASQPAASQPVAVRPSRGRATPTVDDTTQLSLL